MVTHPCNPSTQERRQEEPKFKTYLGDEMRPKTNKQKTNQGKPGEVAGMVMHTCRPIT